MTLGELRTSQATVLTVTQLARLLVDLDGQHVDERTVRRAAEDGQLPCVRVGRRILFPRLQILALLDSPTNSEAGPASPATATTDHASKERRHAQ